jgi:uncharacterized protein YggE
MKKIWLVVIGVVLVIGVVGLVGCNTEGTSELVSVSSQQHGIWVNGEGKVYATPDIAVIALGIEAQAISVAEAQAKASEAMDKVVAALKASGVAEKDIQTQYFSINEVTKWDDGKGESIVAGYRVTNTVTVKVRKVEQAGAVIDAVVVAGGDFTRINGINFTVDDPSTYYAQAREKAIIYAKAKAEQMASLTGVELGKVTYISENSYMAVGNYYNGRLDAASSPTISIPTSVSAGELEISTSVQIAYAIAD